LRGDNQHLHREDHSVYMHDRGRRRVLAKVTG
jgi:hypothetical protein